MKDKNTLPEPQAEQKALERNDPLIIGENISFTFDGDPPVEAVRNIRFSIAEGKITAVIGESGSGKSTLLRLIFGLLPSQTGRILYRGEPVPDPREVLIPGHPKMRMVSQAFDDLNTYATVWDNVSAQLSNTDVSAKQRRTRNVLRRLRILHLRDQRVFDLSGGEKQRVALATALISNPEVLLMDEPFNQVDAAFRESLQEDIREIVLRTKVTVLMVSHDPIEVLSLADQLLVMRKGRLYANGSPETLYERPPNPYTARLLARANVLGQAQAQALGIEPLNGRKVGIHRHAITPITNSNGTHTIKSIWFKGAHYELVLSNGDQTEIRCLIPRDHRFREGDRVDVTVSDFWHFR